MFSEDEIELLAKRIHDKWVEKRIQQGWKYGPVRDDKMKIHPDLIPYEQLPEEKKELDRIFVRNLSRILLNAKFKIVRGQIDYNLTAEDLEKLAKEVHKLWLEKADRSHPYYKPYEDLSEEVKELNRNIVRELLEILREHGFSIEKQDVSTLTNE